MQYVFVPGSHPSLALNELESIDSGIEWSHTSPEVFLGVPSRPAADIFARSAALVKAGQVIMPVDSDSLEVIANLMASLLPYEGRPKFGISCYEGAHNERHAHVFSQCHKLGIQVKRLLKERGQSSRFVTSQGRTLSSVVVEKNQLISSGAEFLLISVGEQLLLGTTVWIQDFVAWGARDFDRPARNAKNGMLPPKLARMMINLSGQEPATSSLWDPFCGSGTTLMEAAVVGFSSITGSDIQERVVKESKKNLRWLEETQEVSADATVLIHDATEPLEPQEHFHAIVGEGDLGKPQTGKESKAFLEDEQKRLSALYAKAIPNLLNHLEPGGRLVLALPYFLRHHSPELTLPLAPKPFSALTSFDISSRGGLLYARKHQRVGREIIVFEK